MRTRLVSEDQVSRSVWPYIGYWLCTLIAVAVVIRRVVALHSPARSGPPQLALLDASFASHAVLTLAHILPALLFVVLAPVAVLSRFADLSWPRWAIYPLGFVVGVTAYAMSVFAVGGWVERSAVLLFNSLFLFALVQSFLANLHRNALQRRRWLLRAVVILLGIATTRPVMGVFFATSRVTHLTPDQFFGFAFWIGFTVNTLAIEAWLRRNDRETSG